MLERVGDADRACRECSLAADGIGDDIGDRQQVWESEQERQDVPIQC